MNKIRITTELGASASNSDFGPSADKGGSNRHGGEGNDDLPGTSGDDTISGGGGDDTIHGGAGDDSVLGGLGDDHESGGSGNDHLGGGEGNDTLSGGLGDDSMNGGSGDDVYIVDSVGDRVTEGSSGGHDRVDATISYHLGANVEDVTLRGTAAIDATGNALNNRERGNSAHNELHGGGGNDALSGAGGDDLLEGGTGNDTLSGGTGDDSLSGGSGADTFVLNSVTGSDAIGDFGSGLDRLLVSEGKFHFGDGDTVVEGGKVASGSGGYSSHAELVIISHDITGDITFASAATAIGHASDSYVEGQHVLFAVDNGTKTAVYDFHSAGHDATVSAGELTLLATLDHTASTTLADYAFGH